MTQFTFSNDPVDLLSYEEGYRDHVYLCPTGYPSAGFGRRVIVLDYETGQPVIFPLRREEEQKDLEDRCNRIHDWLAESYPSWYPQLSKQRQSVLISLTYQVGRDGFKKFKRMLAALSRFDFLSAANEYLDSTAAKQTPKRFARGARILMDDISIDAAISSFTGA